MTKRADILSLLKEEKDFLEKQLKKVVTAIAAFSEEEGASAKAGKKRGPKPRKTVAATKPSATGKKRGRKPKSATPPQDTNPAPDTLGNAELG